MLGEGSDSDLIAFGLRRFCGELTVIALSHEIVARRFLYLPDETGRERSATGVIDRFFPRPLETGPVSRVKY